MKVSIPYPRNRQSKAVEDRVFAGRRFFLSVEDVAA